MRHVLGVIGGLGYESTIHFQTVLMKSLRRRSEFSHREIFPTLVWNVVPPGTDCVTLDDDEVKKFILAGATCLTSIGATLCVLPCNTHCHVSDPRILSMFDALSDHLFREYNGSALGLIATDATARNLKRKLPHITFHVPPSGVVDKLIRSIEGGVTPSTCAELEQVIFGIRNTTIVIGCSDISVCLRRMGSVGKKIIDAHQILADAVIRMFSASS